MSKQARRRRSGFTLAEMIMAVAMLAFFSVFIVQMFAKAEQVSRQTQTLDQAVLIATDLADQWKSDRADVEPEIQRLRQEVEATEEEVMHVDADFERCEPGEAAYLIRMTLQPQEASEPEGRALHRLTIAIWPAEESQDAIFCLTAGRVLPPKEAS